MQLEKVFELEDISRNSGSSDRYAYIPFVIYVASVTDWPPFDPKWWWLGYLVILKIFSFLLLDL